MSAEDVIRRLWLAHKSIHDLKMEKEEEQRRVGNFKENHLFIENFNYCRDRKHFCKHNQLSHWSHEEYLAWLTLKYQPQVQSKESKEPIKQISELPAYVDWKSRGKVTSVKNQGRCGSCWAFSATGAIESAYAIKTNQLVNFSEQQLVDCSTQNNGCNGGLPSLAFEYVCEYGIMKYVDYPYVGQQETCRYQPTDVVKTANYEYVQQTEEALMGAIAEVGPVSIGINASSRSFQFYSSGVYYDSSVSPTPLDHGVLCVGYGYMNDVKFWLVKNSWGTGWGVEGYVYIYRDDRNYMGVTTIPCYPTM